jgi:hypothetical protein
MSIAGVMMDGSERLTRAVLDATLTEARHAHLDLLLPRFGNFDLDATLSIPDMITLAESYLAVEENAAEVARAVDILYAARNRP